MSAPASSASSLSPTSISYRVIATSTNLGSMTTPFVFPSDCLSVMFDFQTTVLGTIWTGLLTQGCAMSSCCPYSKIYTTDYGWYSSYYSPAVCPEDYKTCSGPAEVQSVLPSGVNVAFCCPELYTCPLWPEFSICQTLRYSSATVYVVDNIYSQDIIATSTLTARPTDIEPYYDNAYPIQIRWNDSDFATSSALGNPAPKASGLSIGAKVAIAVVVGLLGLVGLGFLAFWIRKKRTPGKRDSRDAGHPEQVMPDPTMEPSTKAELEDNRGRVLPRSELEGEVMQPEISLLREMP